MTEELCRKLDYHFNNPKLLETALTHSSYSNENNERLEFFGDAVVNFVIAEAIFRQFPKAQEGELSRFRATLINRDTLGKLGRQFELGNYLLLGFGELKSGGRNRTSTVSCAMEAVIGAIYLDSNFETTQECILRWYEPLLASLTDVSNHKDPKTQLQEYLQSKRESLPLYEVESIEGESHQQLFTVSCTVQDEKVLGKGSSRRRAEQEAAENMLKVIKK